MLNRTLNIMMFVEIKVAVDWKVDWQCSVIYGKFISSFLGDHHSLAAVVAIVPFVVMVGSGHLATQNFHPETFVCG